MSGSGEAARPRRLLVAGAGAAVPAILATAVAVLLWPEGEDAAESATESGPSPPEPAEPAGPRTVTLLGGGDLLIHPPVWEQAEADGDGGPDFSEIFAGIEPRVSDADLALCHLETPVAEPEGPFSGYPVFEAPPQVLTGAAGAGYDGCSTASNHTLDHGEEGVARTLEALEVAGMGAAGSARTEQEAAEPTIYEVGVAGGDPVAVAHLSYTFGFNGLSPPDGKQWMADRIDEEAILAEARAARDEGADIVALSMHWGTEYSHDVDSYQDGLAEPLITSSEIDVILGHHAHVVQPVERFEDQWVVYGMGNQLARHSDPLDARREGAMAEVTFVEDDSGEWSTQGLEMVPTWVDIDPEVRLVDLAAAMDDPEVPEGRRETYSQAYDRIAEHLDLRGAGSDGLELSGSS